MVDVSAEYLQSNAAELYAIASTAVAECTAKAAQLAAGQWKSYVKTQLACGGGSLFRHISKQDKEHRNVDITDTSTVVDPDTFLSKQTSAWKELGKNYGVRIMFSMTYSLSFYIILGLTPCLMPTQGNSQ